MGRTRIRSRIATFVAVGGVVALAAACTGSVDPASNSKKNASLVIDEVFNMTTLDPAQVFDVTGAYVLSHTYDTLVTFKGDSVTDVVPRLAESFTASPDAKTFTFKLRKDVKFSDGSPMTSSDVLFSFNRLKNYKGSPSYLMDGISVSAPDNATVVLTTEQPRPELPVLLTSSNFSVVNSAAAKKDGATDATDASKTDKAGPAFDQASMGTGPYVIESYQPNAELQLKANPNYWGPKPHFGQLIFRNTASPQQQSLNVQNGDSQVALNLSSPMISSLDTSKVTVHSSLPPEVVYLGLTNSSGSPTADANFRKAIALGIDYAGLKSLGGPGTVQGTGVIPTSVTGALTADQATTRDVAAAKAALAASGKAGQTVTLEYGSDYKVGGLDMGTFAQRIQSSLAEVGVKVKLKPGPTQVTRTRYQEGKTQMAMWPYPPDFPDPSQFLIYSPGGILAERIHWSPAQSPGIVALADKAAKATDASARVAAFQQWGQAVKETNHFIPLITVAGNVVTAKGITGVEVNPALGPNFALFGQG